MRDIKNRLRLVLAILCMQALLLVKPTVGSWPGFSGVILEHRFYSRGPALQIGDFAGTEAIAFWPNYPCGAVPWAICCGEDGQLYFQKGE